MPKHLSENRFFLFHLKDFLKILMNLGYKALSTEPTVWPVAVTENKVAEELC